MSLVHIEKYFLRICSISENVNYFIRVHCFPSCRRSGSRRHAVNEALDVQIAVPCALLDALARVPRGLSGGARAHRLHPAMRYARDANVRVPHAGAHFCRCQCLRCCCCYIIFALLRRSRTRTIRHPNASEPEHTSVFTFRVDGDGHLLGAHAVCEPAAGRTSFRLRLRLRLIFFVGDALVNQ